jgi:integrase
MCCMSKQVDKKYLKLQRRVWYYVRVIPPKYRHGFLSEEGEPVTTYKRTTKCTSLDLARVQRDGFNLFIQKKFRELDGDNTPILNDKVQEAILSLKELKIADKERVPSTMGRVEANKKDLSISYLQDEAREILEDESRKLLPPDVTPEQFAKEADDGGEYNPALAFRRLDPSGRAAKLYNYALDQSFDFYKDDYFEYLRNYGAKVKTAKGYISAIKEFAKLPDAHLMDDIEVEEWALKQSIELGCQPITVGKKLNKLSCYYVYLARNKKVEWAQGANPFHKVKLTQKEGKGISRLIWTMEDMKKLYLTKTKHYNWELKLLMLLGMIYGCRLEELCQIKKEHIVTKDNVRCIYIAKSKTDIYHKFGRRYLPIVNDLQPIIDRAIEKKQPEDFIISVVKNSATESRGDNLGQRFGNHRVKLGYPRPPKKTFHLDTEVTTQDFHSYRKTVSTNLKAYEPSAKKVSNICGWNSVIKSEEMAENVYNESMKSHPLSERLKTLEQHVASYTFELFKE